MEISKLKEKILLKKELQSIDEEIFDKIFAEEKKNNIKLYNKIKEKKFNEKSKEFKIFVKTVRKKLRSIYGVFFKKALSNDKLKSLLAERNYKKILSSHFSTFERTQHFKEIYKKIFETEKPKRILDLGCGFNPFSYKELGFKPEYVASDISKKNLELIHLFAKQENLPIKTISADLTNSSSLKKISKISENCNITFCFKLLDSLEAQERGTSRKVLNAIKSSVIVVSFPKKSISGKNRIMSERNWFKDIVKDKKTHKFTLGTEEYFVLN